MFPQSILDEIETEEYIPFADDPTIAAKIYIDLDDRDRIKMALKASRLFRQYGHRIHVCFCHHEYVDLNLDKEYLLELIEAGHVDVNREMQKFAKRERFDAVKLLILNGADPNFWNDSFGQTGLLCYCIREMKCDVSFVEFLVHSGASL